MSPTEKTLPQCQDCGACCFGDGPRYIRVSGSDHGRIGADDRLVHFVGNRCYMRLLHTHCAALAVVGPETTVSRFRCMIYESRPEPCRQLERGSDACLAEYARKQNRAQNAAVTGTD